MKYRCNECMGTGCACGGIGLSCYGCCPNGCKTQLEINEKKWEQGMPTGRLKDKQEKINELISLIMDCSEEIWCAQWLTGCEYVFWYDLQVETPPYALDKSVRVEMARLSREIDGWVKWDDDDHEPVYVPLATWWDLYREWTK